MYNYVVKNHQPKISVIIPVYNMGNYIKDCLESIVRQTLADIEIICINDGSTDNSLNILKEYSNTDSRIIIINQKNMGVGKSRNKGIKIAKGKFVCFIDPDDKYPASNILEELYINAIKNNVKICGGELGFFTNENPEAVADYSKKTLSGYWFDSNKLINYNDYQFDYGFYRFIYDRKMLLKKKIFFPPYKRFQDPPFMVKAMITAKNFYAIHIFTYGYRCGHNKIVFTPEKTADFLKGIRDNLKISKKYKLDTLSKFTFIRLKQHFTNHPEIKNNISFKSLILLNTFPKYNSKIKPFLLKENLDIFENYIRPKTEKFFYVKNINKHTVYYLFGIKIKIKQKKIN